MIRTAIIGYGNLGRGVEAALKHSSDMELVAVFTRRDPESVYLQTAGIPVVAYDALADWAERLDVAVLCAGSATDLPEMTPEVARYVNVVDSFDTHSKIPEHYARVQAAAEAHGTLALIAAGWDPGLFSIQRTYASALLPEGSTHTFWGPGISQGHSDALRRLPGVADARQYTLPIPETMEQVRLGTREELPATVKHLRQCYVVLEDGADPAEVEEAIVTLPDYFAGYRTTVTFVTAEELARDHSGQPHGGHVIHSGTTGFDREHTQLIEYTLRLDSNPEFTATTLLAAGRAVRHLRQDTQQTGCITLLDVPPALLSPLSGEDLRRKLL